MISDFNQTEPRFGHINADPKMLGKQQGCDFLAKRRHQNVAHLHVKHFEDRFCRRFDLHLGELGVDISELSPRLNDPCLRGRNYLLLRRGRTGSLLRVSWRNYFALKQFLLAFRFVTQKFQQGHLRLGIVSGAVDLSDGEIAARFQFGRIQLDNWLPGLKVVALLRENFLDASAHARADVHLVHFNRAGDGVPSTTARGEKDRQSKREERANRTADMISCEQFPR